jgi:hypothetical protein
MSPLDFFIHDTAIPPAVLPYNLGRVPYPTLLKGGKP